MCGIYGFSGHRPVDETKIRWLAAENQVRGSDSTGVYGNHLYKDKLKAKEFIQTPGFRAAIKGALTIQGHTRAATVGSVSKENAHPFMFFEGGVATIEEADNVENKFMVVGAHNGFVIPELRQPHTKELGLKDLDVDSMMIFAALAKHKDVNIISKIEMGAAISFVFPNIDKDTLYLYKREETRPLHVGEAPDGLYYSSEPEPLRYIGCRNIWPLSPNMLYTLHKGQIIDTYRMPDAKLKSLAANVQRSTWRSGVPIAEIDAVGLANTTTNRNASFSQIGSEDWSQGRLGFGNWKGGKKDKGDSTLLGDNYRLRIAEDYSTKTSAGPDSVKAKFDLLIRNVVEELKGVDQEILELSEVSSRSESDLNSCLLMVKLTTLEKNKALAAWTVMADNNYELSTLTTINGMGIIKIPYSHCDQTLQFTVYDPVEAIGPFGFKIKPEAARVMEVTLHIPFRKISEKKRKEGSGSNNDHTYDVEHTKNGSNHTIKNPLYVSGDNGSGEVEVCGDGNQKLLRSGEASVCRGDSKREITRQQNQPISTVKRSELCLLSGLDPQSDETNGDNQNDLEKKTRYMIPTMTDVSEKCKLIDKITAVDDAGVYINFRPANEVWEKVIWTNDFVAWMDFYRDNFIMEIDHHNLLYDAARLQCYDRSTTKAWYKLWVYIETLFTYRSADYLREHWVKKYPYKNCDELKPTTILGKGYNPENKVELVIKKN
jgi:hypothetical protein